MSDLFGVGKWLCFVLLLLNVQSFFHSNEEPSKKFLVFLSGNTLDSHKDFIDRLKNQIRLQEVFTVDACDFILVFCPIVSRAGTDIEAAVKKLQNISEIKPAVLVVLHHTFDPEGVIPDSSKAVKRNNIMTVDCLFHEDKGLLQCHKNTESLSTTSEYIRSQNKGQQKDVKKQEDGVKSEMTKRKSFEDLKQLENEDVPHEVSQELKLKDPDIHEARKWLEERQKKHTEICKELEEERSQLDAFRVFLDAHEKTLSDRDAMFEKLKTECVETKQRLEEKESLLTWTQTQLKERDRLHTQTLQMKDKTLEEKDTQVKEVKCELKKTNTMLEENQTLLKDKERQLEDMEKELETSKTQLVKELQDKERTIQELMSKLKKQETESTEKKTQVEVKKSLLTERDTQLQEKDRLLMEHEQPPQRKGKTLEESTRFKEENKQQEEGANTVDEDLTGKRDVLDSEGISQKNKDHLKNNEDRMQAEDVLFKSTNRELEKRANEPQVREGALHEGDQQQKLNNIQTQEVHTQVQKTKTETWGGNDHGSVQDTQHTATDETTEKQMNAAVNESNITESEPQLVESDPELNGAQLDNTHKLQNQNESVENQNTQLSKGGNELGEITKEVQKKQEENVSDPELENSNFSMTSQKLKPEEEKLQLGDDPASEIDD